MKMIFPLDKMYISDSHSLAPLPANVYLRVGGGVRQSGREIGRVVGAHQRRVRAAAPAALRQGQRGVALHAVHGRSQLAVLRAVGEVVGEFLERQDY